MSTTKRQKAFTFEGNPLTALGEALSEGDKAPDFTVVDNDLGEKSLADFSGKVLVLSSVPSLDTSVCAEQTRKFNEELSNTEGAAVLTLSMDLPFAQARWCGASGLEDAITLSDHREASFGLAYGTLIEELRLLGRAVFVADASGTLVHVEYVKEITTHPDYDAALTAVKKALGS